MATSVECFKLRHKAALTNGATVTVEFMRQYRCLRDLLEMVHSYTTYWKRNDLLKITG